MRLRSNSIAREFKKLYGISWSSVFKMCKFIRVSPYLLSKFVSPSRQQRAVQWLNQKQKTEFDLREFEVRRFVHLYTIRHLKALKHKFFLPINGQRNCTNGATSKREAPKMRKLIYAQLKRNH